MNTRKKMINRTAVALVALWACLLYTQAVACGTPDCPPCHTAVKIAGVWYCVPDCSDCEYCDSSNSCQDILASSISEPQYICVGQWASFTATTDPGGYSCRFSWDHQGAAGSQSTCGWSSAKWNQAGVYTVTFGCSGGSSINSTVTVVGVGSIANDRDAVCWNDPNGIVFTAIADPNGPLDCLQWQGRYRDDPNEPWSGWGTVHYSSIPPNQIRLLTGTPGYYQFQARNGSGQNIWAESAEVVVVKLVTIQYNDSTNGWTDIPGIMHAHIDSMIEFRAVKEPNAAPWPSGKPVWSGSSGVSGTGDTKTVTFGTVSSHPTDYKTVQVQCGTMLTANVVVCQAKVENVTFYHGSSSAGHHAALNIRMDYSTDINVPEWVEGGQNMPAAYIMDVNNIDIKVTIDILPPASTTLPATIWATTNATVLGNVNEKDDIYFSAGSSGEVIFTVAGASADAVSKDDVAWQWKVKDFAHSTGEKDINVSGPHTIYTVLDTPKYPEVIPKVIVLDYACVWSDGEKTKRNACNAIVSEFKNHYNWNYDCHRLASDFVRMVASLGVSAFEHTWSIKGAAYWTESYAVGDMYAQRTVLIDPVGNFGPSNYVFGFHEWAEAEGIQYDPSTGSYHGDINDPNSNSSWGDYEDFLYAEYQRINYIILGFIGTEWVVNQPGQIAGPESSSHRKYTSDSTLNLQGWRGP